MENKIIFRGYKVTVKSKDNKVVEYSGDATLIGILKPFFETPIVKSIGGNYIKDKVTTFWEGVITLKPGDSNFIKTVLMEKIRNELGMEVEI